MADNVKDVINEKVKEIQNKVLRECLQTIMSEMAERQDNILQELEKRLKKETNSPNERCPLIGTKLIKNDEKIINEAKNRGFEVMDVGCSFFQWGERVMDEELTTKQAKPALKQFFLDVSYEEKQEYIGQEQPYHAKYKGMSFEFRLRNNLRFVQAENEIIAALRLYNIVDPIIFSPWSRKAIDIELSGDIDIEFVEKIKTDAESVDWQLEANGLNGILLSDKLLAWNILWDKDVHRSNPKVAPDDSLKSYHYSYDAQENQFICLEDIGRVYAVHPDIVQITREGGKIHLVSRTKLDHDDDTRGIADQAKFFTVNEIQEFGDVFCNNKELCAEKLRLRTEADVEWILQKFKKDGFDCKYGKNDSLDRINKYEADYEYYHDGKQMFYKTRLKCYQIHLKFSAEDNKQKFLNDYANYVVYNLNYMYPEFHWIGVKE